MKKIFFIFFLVFSIADLRAQISEYNSYQVAVVKKNSTGEFQVPNEWISKKMKIILDLEKKRLQIWSNDLLGNEQVNPEKEIQLYKANSKSNDKGNKGIATFRGTDNSGERCIVHFNYIKKVNDIYDALMQIEYQNTEYVYKIRKEKT